LTKALLDHSDLGVACLDAEGRVVVWNDWLATRTRIPTDMAAGHSLPELFPQLPASILDALHTVLHEGHPRVLSPVLHKPCIPLHPPARQVVRLLPLHNAKGQIVGAALLIQDVTAQLRYEETAAAALRVSESRLRLMVEQVGAILWTTDRDLRFTASQGAGLADLGLSPNQVVGCSLFEYFQTDDPDFQPIAAHLRALEGESVTYEHTWTGRTYHTRLEPLRAVSGEIIGVIGVSLDVTKHKQAEKALQEQIHRTNQLLRTTLDGYILADTAGQVLDVNPAYCDMIGYSRDELLQMNIRQLEGQLTPEQIEQRIEQMMRQGGARFETRHRHKNGGLIDLDVSITVIPQEKEPLVAAFVRDITERKKAEEEIQRRSRELIALNRLARRVSASLSVEQTVTAALDEVLAAATPDLVLFFLRQGDELLLRGLAPEDGPYRHPETPVHRLGECLCGLAARMGEPLYVRDIRHDPRCTWEECKRAGLRSLAALPLHGGEGVIGVLALASGTERDFEEQADFLETLAGEIAVGLQNALLYEQVRRHAAELEQRVAERTAELEAKNRELETFAYSVSHDLKAPLRGIDGYSRLLLEDYAAQLDEEGRTFLHTIRRATEQMNQLIDDLLTYSRLERRSLTPGRVNPRTLVEALLAERAADIGQRRVSLTVDIPCEYVVADSESLTLALRNLLDNALKFTRDVAQPRIEIGGRQTPDSCIIWVKDNGIGFDMRYHDRIFEIFQRLHRAEDYAGTGVGLAIVRKAAERMRGRVWAESAPGEGATFYLEIPR